MTRTEIHQRVEDFRVQHAPLLNADKIPLDLLSFIELDLGLDVVPFECDRLSQKFGLHPQGISTRLHRERLWPSIY